jgi:hypothetical protein
VSYLYISDLSQTPDAVPAPAPVASAPLAAVVPTPATPPATAADKAAALQRQADALELVASQLDAAGQPAAAAAMRAQATQVRQALADFQATMLPGGALSSTAKIALGIGGALLIGGGLIGWWLSKKESTEVVPLRRNKGGKRTRRNGDEAKGTPDPNCWECRGTGVAPERYTTSGLPFVRRPCDCLSLPHGWRPGDPVPIRKNKPKKLWSHAVVTHWKPSPALFAHGSAEKIAREVLKGHGGLLAPSVSTINFYVNRAGSNLSTAAKKRCKKALELVRARGKSAA